MKRILLLFGLVASITIQAQQNEARLDILDALAMKTLEASYEFSINNETSVGASLLYNFEKEDAKFKYNEKVMFTPYFRYYLPISSTNFSNRFNFFGELFLGINSGKKEGEKKTTGEIEKKVKEYNNYTDGALGVAGGLKYVSEQNFVFDAHAGIGRNMFSEDSPSIVPRIGVSIGYKF